MDPNVLATSGTTAVITALLYGVYKIFRHSKCVSKCCKNDISFTSDLESPGSSRPLIPT